MKAPAWPRMMRRSTAAAYCDLPPNKFLQEVSKGTLPAPVKLGGDELWDIRALDDDLDRIAGNATDWRKAQPGLAA